MRRRKDDRLASVNSAITLYDLDIAWNRGDLSVLDDSLAPDCLGHFPSSAEIRGPQAVKDLVQGFRALFRELRIEVDDLIAAGDKVVARWHATGIAQENQRSVAFTGITIDRFAGGRIVESWSEWDSAGLAAQIEAKT
jgi:predicted ester cyclase